MAMYGNLVMMTARRVFGYCETDTTHDKEIKMALDENQKQKKIDQNIVASMCCKYQN